MDQLSKYINTIWKIQLGKFKLRYDNVPNYTPNKNEHILIQDINFVDKIHAYIPVANDDTDIENICIDDCFTTSKCNYIPHEKLSEDFVNSMYKRLTDYKNFVKWKDIEPDLANMYNYLLYSNIDIKKYRKDLLLNKNNDTINILILGAGPTGLYIANYINNCSFLSPNINLLVIDNRIINTNKGLRLPYTRNRLYGVSFDLFSSFFPKFPCIKKLVKEGTIEIKYLENLLIILAYGNNIPLYFTDKVINEETLHSFIKKYSIDVVFDCTGNRLKNSLIHKDNVFHKNYFDPNSVLDTTDYSVDIEDNNAVLKWKKGFKNKYYLSIEIFDKDGKFVGIQTPSFPILYEDDIKILYNLHNKCVQLKSSIKDVDKGLLDRLKDRELAKIIRVAIMFNLDNYDNHLKFYVVEPKLYHKLEISTVIKHQNSNTLYIGAGDTIFSSHFYIGAGLNRLLNFSNQVVWALQQLSTIA